LAPRHMSEKQHCDGQLQSGFHSLTGESERHTSECESPPDEGERHSAAGESHDIDMTISECPLSDEGDLSNTAFAYDVEKQRATPSHILDGGAGDVISRSTTDTTFWRRIADFPKQRPFVTSLIVATIKACVADMFVQVVEYKCDEIDWTRFAVFLAFGFLYAGAFQYFIYVSVFSRLCPNAIHFSKLPLAEKLRDTAGIRDLFAQVLLDNFIHHPFMYLPAFYLVKESIQALETSLSIDETMVSAITMYWNNIVEDSVAMLCFWFPGDLLVYAVPIWMRLPAVHTVSLSWTMILSFIRGAAD